MEERLLELNGDISVKKLIDRINEIVGNKFTILDQKDDIEKWNGIPKLLTLDDNAQQKLLKFVEYVDNLLQPIEVKAMYVVSLSALIEFGKIDINIYDEGSLFTLADYYQNSSINDIKNTLPIIKNSTLLLAVRQKTLDIEARKKILLDIVNSFISDKISTANQDKYNKFINDKINEIEAKDYYDLVK